LHAYLSLYDNHCCLLWQNLESLSFCCHGDEFISAHIDGSYAVWSSSDATRPKFEPVTPYGLSNDIWCLLSACLSLAAHVCNTQTLIFLSLQVKSSQVAFNEWVWQLHKLTIKIQLINVQTQKKTYHKNSKTHSTKKHTTKTVKHSTRTNSTKYMWE